MTTNGLDECLQSSYYTTGLKQLSLVFMMLSLKL